jgi:hypothetical protein
MDLRCGGASARWLRNEEAVELASSRMRCAPAGVRCPCHHGAFWRPAQLNVPLKPTSVRLWEPEPGTTEAGRRAWDQKHHTVDAVAVRFMACILAVPATATLALPI